MRKEYLDLLSQLQRDHVLVGLGDVAGSLSGVFMFLASELASIRARAAHGLGWAGWADLVQGARAGGAFVGRPTGWVGIGPAELLQLVPLGSDVLVVLCIPLEVGAGPGPTIADPPTQCGN